MPKRAYAFILTIIFISLLFPATAFAENELKIDAKSYILMDVLTGKVLSEKDADKPLPAANVVKTMSMLLFMEAVDEGRLKLTDDITVSKNAHGKGGTTVFLDTGKTYEAMDLLKAVAVCSANDACTALAEYISGSEEEFVKRMNGRAETLGLKNSKFVNTTGIDAQGQASSARDIAVISRELMAHPMILKWSGIWMEDFTHEGGRVTQMVNYNKLVKFYEGCDGFKTGSSAAAGYCISATARRGSGRFIYVGLGSRDSESRFDGAKKAFDYAFSNYVSKCIVKKDAVLKKDIAVAKGDTQKIDAYAASDLCVLIPKGQESSLKKEITVAEDLTAPLKAGQAIGRFTVSAGEEELGFTDIICKQDVSELDYITSLKKALFWWLF